MTDLILMSVEEIVTLLRSQADGRSPENDERGILRSAADRIEREMRELEPVHSPSPRHALALRLAQIVIDGDMCRPFGGDVTLSRDRRNYGFGFSRPATLDGAVAVYSPSFIQIVMQGRGAPNGNFSAIYESEEAAAQVLMHMVACEPNLAARVPRRDPSTMHPRHRH